MWQRKQTIFLGIAIICLVLSVFFPIWVGQEGDKEKMLFPLHYTVKTGDLRNAVYFPYMITAILSIAAATIAAMEITRYDNRLLQLKLAALNSLLMTGVIGSSVYFAIQLIKNNQITGHYGLGLWLPGVAIFSNLIANRFIRKDEKIIRDSNRIR
jgi:hypothetical protein